MSRRELRHTTYVSRLRPGLGKREERVHKVAFYFGVQRDVGKFWVAQREGWISHFLGQRMERLCIGNRLKHQTLLKDHSLFMAGGGLVRM